MNRFIVVFVLLLYSQVWSLAQVPGYLGKKVAIGYTLNSGMPFARTFMEGSYAPDVNYSGNSNLIFLPIRHNLNLEWVLTEKISVEGGVGFYKAGMFSSESEPNYIEMEYAGLSRNASRWSSPSKYDYVRTSNQYYKFGFNFFSGNYLAPHGTYWNLSYMRNTGIIQYVLNDVSTDFAIITSNGFAVTKGFRNILFNSIIFDYGFGFGYMFGKKQESGNLMAEQTLIGNQTSMLNAGILLNVHVGIKYLFPKFY